MEGDTFWSVFAVGIHLIEFISGRICPSPLDWKNLPLNGYCPSCRFYVAEIPHISFFILSVKRLMALPKGRFFFMPLRLQKEWCFFTVKYVNNNFMWANTKCKLAVLTPNNTGWYIFLFNCIARGWTLKISLLIFDLLYGILPFHLMILMLSKR